MKKLLLLLTLIVSLGISESLVTAQSEEDLISEEICRSVVDAQAETQRLKECELDRRELDLLKQQLENKDDKIANLEEKLKLKTEEGMIKDEMMKVKDQRIASDEKVIAQWGDLTDRSIKLAEAGKPKSVWETWGPLGIIVIIIVTIATTL